MHPPHRPGVRARRAGTPDYLFKDGVLVAERRRPSDRLLMWLLTHFDSVGFGWMGRTAMSTDFEDLRWGAVNRLPEMIEGPRRRFR